jgi:hypothetical protein
LELGTVTGAVRIRSNIVLDQEAWDLVPGEIVDTYRRGHFDLPNRPPLRQRDEHMYYRPCGLCGRTIDVINLEGCDDCRDAPRPEQVAANRERHMAIMQRVVDERTRLRGERNS